MTKHPIKRYVDELGGSGVFAEIYAHARVGEPGFLRKLLSRKDPELETRVKRLTETAIDVERRGGNTSDNRPIFETRKEKSEFDDVYSCLANIARDYYAAHSESREAADSRHSACMLHPLFLFWYTYLTCISSSSATT